MFDNIINNKPLFQKIINAYICLAVFLFLFTMYVMFSEINMGILGYLTNVAYAILMYQLCLPTIIVVGNVMIKAIKEKDHEFINKKNLFPFILVGVVLLVPFVLGSNFFIKSCLDIPYLINPKVITTNNYQLDIDTRDCRAGKICDEKKYVLTFIDDSKHSYEFNIDEEIYDTLEEDKTSQLKIELYPYTNVISSIELAK